MSVISGPCATATQSLSPDQLSFLLSLPKAELHAHLNGSIPLSVLQELAREYQPDAGTLDDDSVQAGIKKLRDGVSFNEIDDFFAIFPPIYALTSTPASLARVTRAVLGSFLDGPSPQCHYIELRTTPRSSSHMTREAYLRTVLNEIHQYESSQAALIVSLDRKMSGEVVEECVRLAKMLKGEGKRVVGLDLCGNPLAGDIGTFAKHFEDAKNAGLGITVHIAEVDNSENDVLQLLALNPDRLGHATFLSEQAQAIVGSRKDQVCIEMCLSSNLLCKTVPSLQDHHILNYFEKNHPIAICTDDQLPFRNSLIGEYALLMAKPPLGLGLGEREITKIAAMGMQFAFGRQSLRTISELA